MHGIIRPTSTFNTDRIDRIYQASHIAGAKLFLHYGALADGVTLRRLLELVQPHEEIYNLGAQSHVRVSFEAPEYTVDIVAMGALRLLEAIRDYEQLKRTPSPLLPSWLLRNVWTSPGSPPIRNHPLLSP